jgi:hypothetical protein
MNEIDFNWIINWVADQLDPRVNIFAAAGITLLTQFLKKPIPVQENSVMIIPLILSGIMALLHLVSEPMNLIQIGVTILTYFVLSAGFYILLIKMKWFKKKYELGGNVDRRKR